MGAHGPLLSVMAFPLIYKLTFLSFLTVRFYKRPVYVSSLS